MPRTCGRDVPKVFPRYLSSGLPGGWGAWRRVDGKDLRANTSNPHAVPEVFPCHLWAGFRGSHSQGLARKDLKRTTLKPNIGRNILAFPGFGVVPLPVSILRACRPLCRPCSAPPPWPLQPRGLCGYVRCSPTELDASRGDKEKRTDANMFYIFWSGLVCFLSSGEFLEQSRRCYNPCPDKRPHRETEARHRALA